MSTRYTPELYGESFADVYDLWYGQVSDADASAEFIHGLCGTGRVLELGVGTGRLALPLLASGMTVVGVDASLAMLRRCPQTDGLTLLLSDMRGLPFNPDTARFDGALIGFNTLFNLVSATEQEQLFCDVFSLLRPGGYLIIEATNHNVFAADTASTEPTHSFGVTRRTAEAVVVASTTVDHHLQKIDGCHIEISDRGATLRPWKLRWCSTEQLDSFAANAGLRLHTRLADWDGAKYRSSSTNHISVYQRP